ncbi:MAG: F0F1 ATP synthase subunit epsilon [Leptolyngbya sp. SIO1D8]|nr:F0F1 ATP synthase subunit epsilon [Leptolyngbya sp. SIO1D8]
MSLTVRVIAPDKTVWDAEAEEVILPSTTGQLGILGGHAPLMTALDVGVMRVRPQSGWVSIALMGGFAEVEDDEVTILVRGAERGEEIDQASAQSDYEQAQAKMTSVSQDDRRASMQARQSLRRARARLQASGGNV